MSGKENNVGRTCAQAATMACGWAMAGVDGEDEFVNQERWLG